MPEHTPAAPHPPRDNRRVTQPETRLLLFDFGHPDTVKAWTAIDDRVMGGVSRSGLRHDPAGHAVFEGTVSLEQGGGFASVRSSPGARGKAGAQTCEIEGRGDGKHYKLTFITDDGWDSLSYQATFIPATGDWQTIVIPMSAFHPSFRGREVRGAPPLNPASIRQVGLMIAGRQAGAFALAIRHMALA